MTNAVVHSSEQFLGIGIHEGELLLESGTTLLEEVAEVLLSLRSISLGVLKEPPSSNHGTSVVLAIEPLPENCKFGGLLNIEWHFLLELEVIEDTAVVNRLGKFLKILSDLMEFLLANIRHVVLLVCHSAEPNADLTFFNKLCGKESVLVELGSIDHRDDQASLLQHVAVKLDMGIIEGGNFL